MSRPGLDEKKPTHAHSTLGKLSNIPTYGGLGVRVLAVPAGPAVQADQARPDRTGKLRSCTVHFAHALKIDVEQRIKIFWLREKKIRLFPTARLGTYVSCDP